MTENYTILLKKYPFISYIKNGDSEFVGIVINKDASIISIYDYNALPSIEIKERFLELGDIWWWESNQKFPINIFLKEDFIPFKPFIRSFITKDTEIVYGPQVSMNDFAQKRTKRRNIQLVVNAD